MNEIPVFYTSKMVANYACPSPSAAKPAKVVESWQRQFPIALHEPQPVTIDQLALAHDRSFVEAVLACQSNNGFGDRSPEAAAALPYTSGAMLSAARHVLTTKAVAAAPCSGFHHAEWATAMGYCTFNGLMVTALTLKGEGLVNTVGILDLDMHYGNGTDDIMRHTGSESWIRHFTGGAMFTRPEHAPDFFRLLPSILLQMSRCDIVLYQAGADPHINDPHGGWLTTEELRMRDAQVFDALKASGTPVVWNLAGGYQVEPDGSIPKVLEVHDNTMRECVRVYT